MPPILLILLIAAIIALSGFRIAQQYERALVFRFGRYTATRGPGLFWIIPFAETIVKIDMRVLTDGVEQQETMTKDNVPIKVNAVIWYRVVKPDLAYIEVANVRNAVIQAALTTLRNAIGQHTLDDAQKEAAPLRDQISKARQDIADAVQAGKNSD